MDLCCLPHEGRWGTKASRVTVVYQDLLASQAILDQQDKKENMDSLDVRGGQGCLEGKVTEEMQLVCRDLQALLAHPDLLEEFLD